jgi:hypothetical protein
LEVDVDKIISLTGHDGSDIQWPQLKPPRCYRSWHIQELIKVCLSLGYAVTEISENMISNPGVAVLDYVQPDAEYFFWTLAHCKGILPVLTKSGHGHALAFKYGELLDPATCLKTSLQNYTHSSTLYRVDKLIESEKKRN